MSVLIRYNTANATREQYDKVNEFFQERMQQDPDMRPPKELQVHVMFGEEGDLQISEVWESEEAWRQGYDGILGEALDQAGVERNPQVIPVHELWGMGVPAPQRS